MASQEFEQLLKLFPPGFADPSDSALQVRKKMAPVHGHPLPDGTRVERVSMGGVPAAWVTAPGVRDDRSIVHLHGGAFVSCDLDAYLFYAAMLSVPLQARVLAVGYRLAPEHRFPAALDDCVAAVHGSLEAGTRPERLGLIGDSCGGGLVISTLLRLRDAGQPLPACAVTLGGWFDLLASGESAEQPVGLDPFIDPEWLRQRGRDYVGPQGDPADPLASPLYARLHGLPPLLLQAGQVDITRDDATRLAARAARDGVAVQLDVWPEMIHGWQGLATAGLPEAVAALERAGRFVAEHCPAGG